jgi:hypothetical protein
MAYILQHNESQPPQKIQKRFDDIVDSITVGIDTLHPENMGYQVDESVRNHLISREYPNYNHST